VVARWAPGSDPQRALESVASRDRSGLCAAEAARLADPPAPPDGWDTHPLTGREQAYFPAGRCEQRPVGRGQGRGQCPAGALFGLALFLRSGGGSSQLLIRR
jgi:hypothetical protein